MIRGEFIHTLPGGDEHVVPNQFTLFGVQLLMRAAFWGQRTDLLRLGLCAHNPADNIALINVQEPTIGVNGYERMVLPMDEVNWPTLGIVNSETYIETRNFTFNLTGAVDVAVNRFFLTDQTHVIAISSALEGGMQYFDAPFTTRYRLYLR